VNLSGTSTRLRTGIAVLLLSVCALVPAGASSASASDGDLAARLRIACLRIPDIETRVTAVITRLEGPVDIKGSLAWFDAHIAQATAANHPRIALDLQTRRDVLAAKLDLLHHRQDRLTKATDYCRSKGVAI